MTKDFHYCFYDSNLNPIKKKDCCHYDALCYINDDLGFNEIVELFNYGLVGHHMGNEENPFYSLDNIQTSIKSAMLNFDNFEILRFALRKVYTDMDIISEIFQMTRILDGVINYNLEHENKIAYISFWMA